MARHGPYEGRGESGDDELDERIRLARQSLSGNYTFRQVCAALVCEPYNLTLPDIEQLDPRQVRHVYFAPRDKDGRPEADDGAASCDAEVMAILEAAEDG